MAEVEATIADSIRLVPTETIVLVRPASVVDAIRVGEGLLAYYGMVVTEALKLGSVASPNTIGHVSLTEAIVLIDQLYQARNVEIIETVGIEHLQALQQAIGIVEGLGLSEALQGAARYHLNLTDALRLTVSLGNFFGAEIVDGLGLTDDLFGRVLAFAHVDEGVGIEASVQPQLLLNVVVDESIDVTAELAVRMLFNPTLVDGIEISAGLLEPNGAFTTWAMNTRTGAVTEYSDYVFNSFAQIGNKYVGASEDGIFELTGDTDDGADIIARIKGGFMQFGGTQLSRLKEAYIAATGEGVMILRIRTKDNETYNYSVDTRDGRSTKVHMGKGQRSRYFAFELISAGQDFDLDTLEFVPIVVGRRV